MSRNKINCEHYWRFGMPTTDKKVCVNCGEIRENDNIQRVETMKKKIIVIGGG